MNIDISEFHQLPAWATSPCELFEFCRADAVVNFRGHHLCLEHCKQGVDLERRLIFECYCATDHWYDQPARRYADAFWQPPQEEPPLWDKAVRELEEFDLVQHRVDYLSNER